MTKIIRDQFELVDFWESCVLSALHGGKNEMAAVYCANYALDQLRLNINRERFADITVEDERDLPFATLTTPPVASHSGAGPVLTGSEPSTCQASSAQTPKSASGERMTATELSALQSISEKSSFASLQEPTTFAEETMEIQQGVVYGERATPGFAEFARRKAAGEVYNPRTRRWEKM